MGAGFSDETLQAQPGLNIADMMGLSLARNQALFRDLHLPAPLDEASDLLLDAIRARLDTTWWPGLDYLTLDRQSRIALRGRGAAHQPDHGSRHLLVNMHPFVLDEPSIGLQSEGHGSKLLV